MKNKFMLAAVVIVLSGCNVQAEPSSANNDLVQIESQPRVLSAADVDLTNPYYFAYSDQPIDEYDTFKTTNPITITVDQDTKLSIFGAAEPLEDLDFVTPTEEISLTAGGSYTFESNYPYYKINSTQPTTGVISVT